MVKLLRGNYEVGKIKGRKNKKTNANISKIFEHKAMEKLGGSIAFVMKKDKFVWSGDEEAE